MRNFTEQERLHIHTAVLRAADTIEQNPDRFDFIETNVPKQYVPYGRACALGWIAYHLSPRYRFFAEAARVLSPNCDELFAVRLFYKQMDDIAWSPHQFRWSVNWRHDAKDCAQCLRIYARSYFGIKKATLNDHRPAFLRPLLQRVRAAVTA